MTQGVMCNVIKLIVDSHVHYTYLIRVYNVRAKLLGDLMSQLGRGMAKCLPHL